MAIVCPASLPWFTTLTAMTSELREVDANELILARYLFDPFGNTLAWRSEMSETNRPQGPARNPPVVNQ